MTPFQDFPYYGVEDGDSCYCGDNADKLVPANPEECSTPCTGDEDQDCGNTFFRMNAYGPIFRAISPNLLIFKNRTLPPWFEIDIQLKLDGNPTDEKQNVYGFMKEGSTYPEAASQIASVYINPDNTLEVCAEIEGATECGQTSVVDLDTWFSLWIESWCWFDLNGDFFCALFVLKDYEYEFFLGWDGETQVNVDGFIGNTYGEEFEAASGDFKDFELYPYENRDAPSSNLANLADIDVNNIDLTAAANAAK